jgi:hypothetical protein
VRTRFALLVLVACLAHLPAASARDAGAVFAPSLPDGVGDVSDWERITGEFETTTARGAYWLYVNPARPAMYQLMRYRVELLPGWPGAQGRRGAAERVAFVRKPGVREPMLFWELDPPGAGHGWRAIAAGTEEYRTEIAVLMAVLGVHRAARSPLPPPS